MPYKHSAESQAAALSLPFPEVRESEDLLTRENIKIALNLVSTAVKKKERYKFKHAKETGKTMLKFAKALGIENQKEILRAGVAGFLHDIGKAGDDKKLWEQPHLGKIDWSQIHKHPKKGKEILSKVGLKEIAEIVGCHHEKWNGKGYPNRLKGEKIPLTSRMLTLSDSFDSMINKHGANSNRIKTPAAAIAILKKEAGKQFDPELVPIFVEMMEEKYSLKPSQESVNEDKEQVALKKMNARGAMEEMQEKAVKKFNKEADLVFAEMEEKSNLVKSPSETRGNLSEVESSAA